MKIRQILSAISLTTCVISLYWLLQKPRSISTPQPREAMIANAQSFQNKLEQLERAKSQGQPNAEIHFNSDEVGAALAQATGSMPSIQPSPVASTSSAPQAAAPPEQPTIKDYQVSFEGDVVTGQFLTQLAGKDIWVTVAGHLGARDGYATFEPTQFKVGEMSVPVSLVNEALQKKLAEQRDQLKLPDYIGDLRIENGELVMKEK